MRRVLAALLVVLLVPAGAARAATPVPGHVQAVVAEHPQAMAAEDVRTVRRLPAPRVPVTRLSRAAVTDGRTHAVYVALVTPRGWRGGPPPSESAARTAVERASSWWGSQTGGQVRFVTAAVTPRYTSAYTCTGNDGVNAIWAEASERFGLDPAGGYLVDGVDRHLLVMLPEGSTEVGCDYGLATVGALHSAYNAVVVAAAEQSVVAHELGHNLGLHHSNALHCATSDAVAGTAGQWPAGCYAEEYGDVLDVMGYSGGGYGEGNLNVVHVAAMDLLPGAVRTLPPGVTTVRIAPLSAGVGALRGVRVVAADGTAYAVEYRTATGRDAVTEDLRASTGVRVLREDPRPGVGAAGSYLLDATPSGARADRSGGLATGRTFTAAGGVVRVRVDAADALGATLTVANGVALPTAPPSRVSVRGLPSLATVGTALTARVAVASASGSPVYGWPVELQRRLPGSTRWTPVTRGATDSAGGAALRATAGRTAAYRVVALPRDGSAGAAGAAITVSAR